MGEQNFTNCTIVKNIIAREYNHYGKFDIGLSYKFLDLYDEENQKLLAETIEQYMKIFTDALEELNGCK